MPVALDLAHKDQFPYHFHVDNFFENAPNDIITAIENGSMKSPQNVSFSQIHVCLYNKEDASFHTVAPHVRKNINITYTLCVATGDAVALY